MSDSNAGLIRMIEESTFATTPSSPTMTELRFTSESVDQETDTTSSEEIRSDRQVTDVIRTSVNAAGDLNYELSFESFDNGSNAVDLIGGAMANSWSTDVAASGQIDVDSTNSQFTSDTSASGPDLSNVNVGQWILTANFSNSGNNDYFRVTGVDTSSTTHTVTVADPDGNLVTETGDGDETMDGQAIFNGTTLRTWTLEKEFTDVSLFDRFLGLAVASWNMEISSNSQISGAFTMSGQKAESNVTSSVASSTNSSPTTQIMNSIDHVAMIREGGSSTTLDTESISFTLENNIRPQNVVGNLGPKDLGLGTINATGSFVTYFSSRSLLDKYRDFSTSSLSYKVEDDAGNAYIIDFPQVRYTSGPVVIEGLDEFVMASMEFMAHIDDSENNTMSVTRFPAS